MSHLESTDLTHSALVPSLPIFMGISVISVQEVSDGQSTSEFLPIPTHCSDLVQQVQAFAEEQEGQ